MHPHRRDYFFRAMGRCWKAFIKRRGVSVLTENIEDPQAGGLPEHITFRVRHHRTYLIIHLVEVAILLIVFALIAYAVKDYIGSLESWVQEMGSWAPLLFVLGAAFLCVIFVPQTVMGVAGGVLFGVGFGVLYVFIAEFLAALISFFLGRQFFRRRVVKLIKKHPRFGIFDRAPPGKRLRLMFLMRLAPANFALLNYVCAVSTVKLSRYLLALIGVLPGNLCTVYAGDVAKHVNRLARGTEHDSVMHYALMIGGLFLAIVAIFFIARIAYKMAKEDSQATDRSGA